jgi:hypothetical protein
MPEFLVTNLLGNMPLILTNKLFKSPTGLIFECSGIVRDVPIEINKTEVHLDFHIFAILNFELLIGYPFEKHFQKKPSHGSLGEECGKTTSTTHLENPMVEHYPNHNLFEEKLVTLFISLSPSLKHRPCPSSHQNVVLDGGQDSTLFPHDISLQNENFCATDILLSATCFHEDHNHLLIRVSKLFKRMVIDAFVYHKYCKSCSCIVALTL